MASSEVAFRPAKPTVVYDGECHFCGLWIQRWRQEIGERVDFLALQDPRVREAFPELERDPLEKAIHLVETDGKVYRGAEAAFRALAHCPEKRWMLWLYDHVRGADLISEWAYRLVADHRSFFSRLTHWFCGEHLEYPRYELVRRLFLVALGAVFLVAFVSLWTQIGGLVGSNGILPADKYMDGLREAAARQGLGWERYHLVPTLCWLSGSDGFLQFQCAAGAVGSVFLMANVAPPLTVFLLWMLYLSLAVICRPFLGFQWDNLLLETGFLAIFLSPWQWWPGRGRAAPRSRFVVGLLRWLLFRLMFQSGCVKLLSGDPLWRNLRALEVHYETQPLPTWIAWYAHHLPVWAQKVSVLGMFGVELIVPFFVFGPRRLRYAAFWAFVLLQALIGLTGNYGFFNLLSLVLCLVLLDDAVLERLLPARGKAWWTGRRLRDDRPVRRGWPKWVVGLVGAVIVLLSATQLAGMFGWWIRPLVACYAWAAPFRSVNSYGLFALMTPKRPEIIVEGSEDGRQWKAYEFKYKPGNVAERPRFVAPHQPRLDWQMWFAALGNYQQNPWFVNFSSRLLQGSPEVLDLLEKNPFPGHPPRYVRAMVYDYRFTDAAGKAKGAWWQRELQGPYAPVFSLRDTERQVQVR